MGSVSVKTWLLHRRKLLSELEGTRTILESASQHDFLTGLHNRSKFVEDLSQMIGQEVPCTVIMLDIDDFKNINDVYGHAAGDRVEKRTPIWFWCPPVQTAAFCDADCHITQSPI